MGKMTQGKCVPRDDAPLLLPMLPWPQGFQEGPSGGGTKPLRTAAHLPGWQGGC